MFKTDKRDAMYSEKLNDIIQELPFAIPTIDEITKLTGLQKAKATAYAKLSGVAVDPFQNGSSYIVIGKNNEASYIDPYGSCKVLDEKRHKYSGVRPIIREDELSNDVKNALRYMCQVGGPYMRIPFGSRLDTKNSKRYKHVKDRLVGSCLALECINLGTIPMELTERDEENEFMAAKDNYDQGNSSLQFEKTSRVFSGNLGLGNIEVTDPVYLFRGREFVLTRTGSLPYNLNYAYVEGEYNGEVLLEHSSITINRKQNAKDLNEYSAREIIVESRSINEWHQALLNVQPVTWVYDPRARIYICEQIIASAKDISCDNFQLPNDFAKQFVKYM